ncbi:hypothetical protein C0J52_25202 [Blattella germanica]|nr:hypothetical protein C0J52_25202 [Blattella germanica]
MKKTDEKKITAAELKSMRMTAGCSLLEHLRNADILEELKINPIVEYVQHYRRNWKSHVQRMNNNRAPKQILAYNPRGCRILRRPMKRWRENTMVMIVMLHSCSQQKQYGIRAWISDVMVWPATLIRWEKIKKTITKLFAHFTFKSPPISSSVEYLKEMKSGKRKMAENSKKKNKKGKTKNKKRGEVLEKTLLTARFLFIKWDPLGPFFTQHVPAGFRSTLTTWSPTGKSRETPFCVLAKLSADARLLFQELNIVSGSAISHSVSHDIRFHSESKCNPSKAKKKRRGLKTAYHRMESSESDQEVVNGHNSQRQMSDSECVHDDNKTKFEA